MKYNGSDIEVLIIEDNPGELYLTRLMLKDTGHTSFHVTQADCLKSGIELISGSKPDVILLDLGLPDSQGIDTYARLKCQAQEIPVVVLSGLEDENVSRQAVREGAQDYLTKGQIDSKLLEHSLHYAIERQKAEDTIRRLAYHDALTGLPNRLLFKDRFKLAVAGGRRYQKKTGLLLFDLDHFKEVNDSMGHDSGDELLKQVGDRLAKILRQTDTISRFGGDEFAVLLPELTRIDDALDIAKKVLKAVRMPFYLNRREVRITASIGVAVCPEDGEDLEALISLADKASYEVKKTGRNNYFHFDSMIYAILPDAVK